MYILVTQTYENDQIKSFVEDKLKYSIKKLPISVCYSSKVGQKISFSDMFMNVISTTNDIHSKLYHLLHTCSSLAQIFKFLTLIHSKIWSSPLAKSSSVQFIS